MENLPLHGTDDPAWETAVICALQQATNAITSTRELDETLNSVLDACSEGIGCPFSSVALLDVEGDWITGRLVYSRSSRESLRRIGVERLPDTVRLQPYASENLLGRVFVEQTQLLTTRFADVTCPPLRAKAAIAVQEAMEISAIALTPIAAQGSCLGVLTITSAGAHRITQASLALLRILAGQVAMAIANRRLQVDLRDRERQVSHLLKATIDAQEEERERICLEIHDGITQSLSGAYHYLQALDSQPELLDDSRTSVRKAAMLVRGVIREAREVIATLRPAALDTLGLVVTLREEMEEIRAQRGLRVEFQADTARYPKAIEIALYRIVHEAVNNVVKHARASSVLVRMKHGQGCVLVEVQDDGIGFDPAALERQLHPKSVGLLSMRKRTELLNGTFSVISRTGEGTLVRVEVPLLDQEGGRDG